MDLYIYAFIYVLERFKNDDLKIKQKLKLWNVYKEVKKKYFYCSWNYFALFKQIKKSWQIKLFAYFSQTQNHQQ